MEVDFDDDSVDILLYQGPLNDGVESRDVELDDVDGTSSSSGGSFVYKKSSRHSSSADFRIKTGARTTDASLCSSSIL